jgi:hypothetical protein
MQESPLTALQAIQALLAPAVGISAVGLLLLGLNNRYSIIINRIRLLNEERRRYLRVLSEKDSLEYADNVRFMSISNQSKELLIRSRLVRNAILSMQLSIALFVLTSVTVGISLFISTDLAKAVPLVVFIIGMVSVLVGILFAAGEVHRSYKIILLEVKAE